MRSLPAIPLLGLSLLALGLGSSAPPVALAALALAGAVGTAVVVNGERSWRVVVAGSAAALAAVILADVFVPAAGAAFVALVYAPRIVRARSTTTAIALGATAALCGLAGAFIAGEYLHAAWTLRLAAAAVAGTLAISPLLFSVDEALTAELLALASACPEPARASLLRAAILRRGVDPDLFDALSPEARRRLESAWTTLRDLAVARAALADSKRERLDARIAAHVHALERTHAAAEDARVVAASISDRTLGELRIFTENLETEASAMAEVADASGPHAPERSDPTLPPATQPPRDATVENIAAPRTEGYASNVALRVEIPKGAA